MDTHGFEGVNPAVLAAWQDHAPQNDRPGPDWLTAIELSHLWGVSRDVAAHRANRLVGAGRAERRKAGQGRGATVFFRLREG